MKNRLGAYAFGGYTVFTVDHMAVEGILYIFCAARLGGAENAFDVCFIIRKKGVARSRAVQAHQTQAVIELQILERFDGGTICFEDGPIILCRAFANYGFDSFRGAPGPGISEPQMRKDMQNRVLGTAIECFDAYADVFGAGLGIFNKNIEVAVVVKDAGIEQLELWIFSAAATVFLDQVIVGKFILGIFI